MIPPIIPYGGFSPVRLEGWPIRWGLPEALVGRTVFDALGPDGIFINVARGWLVDEQALIDASGENVVANLVSWFEGTGPVTPVTR